MVPKSKALERLMNQQSVFTNYSVSGEANGSLTLHLTSTNSLSLFRLGHVNAVCGLRPNGSLSGSWKSQTGTQGTFTAQRKDEPEDETPSNSIFIVHGHDDGAKEKVARFLEKLGLIPIILQEQINRGRTVLEKFEDFTAKAGFAIILITADDYGYPIGNEIKKALRARQNVILELGYFAGKLGREKTFVLRKGDVEFPSDILGLGYYD